ncbi:hypothetical protein [Streptomyces sp. NPDC127084]|uniref:hypothetical protein n=1 Tax=Streptomyces sp. NPDC127084 TaxID=3347133 RepID=UPI003663F526
MAEMRRVTVLLPAEVVVGLERLSGDVPGIVAGMVTERVGAEVEVGCARRRLVREELDRYGEEHGAFTEEELDAARARIRQVLGGDFRGAGPADR